MRHGSMTVERLDAVLITIPNLSSFIIEHTSVLNLSIIRSLEF